MDKKVLQIIDANLNRTREGLRVCEDIVRFSVRDRNVSSSLKLIRHDATKAILGSDILDLKKLLDARDVKKDLSKFIDYKKNNSTLADLFMSNIERVKESLRVLEECLKLVDDGLSSKYRKLRFDTYHAEKKIIKKIGTHK
ncbi:MAG: thiamine-phosphate pyrophosphorylase [Candidatus Omnitrophota bacterium]